MKHSRRIVIINQAANYLTVGLANAFNEKFENVSLISGSIHTQGEELHPEIEVTKINKWAEQPPKKKLFSYIKAMVKIYSLLWTKYYKHEVFFVSLPPMAYLLNLVLPHRFSMLIWDVYPDVFKITGMTERHPMYRGWAYLNRFSFRKAYRVFTIGKKMSQLLEKYTDKSKILITPIWSIFQENERIPEQENHFISEHGLQGKFIVQYSGNIGLTHKVELMVQMAEKMKENKNIVFQIIGRGPRVQHLKKLVEEKNLSNCHFLPFQSDKMFPYSLSAANLGVVILDELTARGSVPSKSYNLMSFGIPSLYIASNDSELHDYATNFRHAECYQESELNKAVNFIINLSADNNLVNFYSSNALKAAKQFRRENADKIVDLYLNSNI